MISFGVISVWVEFVCRLCGVMIFFVGFIRSLRIVVVIFFGCCLMFEKFRVLVVGVLLNLIIGSVSFVVVMVSRVLIVSELLVYMRVLGICFVVSVVFR